MKDRLPASFGALRRRVQSITDISRQFFMEGVSSDLASDEACQTSVIRIIVVASAVLATLISLLSFRDAATQNIVATCIAIAVSYVIMTAALWQSARQPRAARTLLIALVYAVGTILILFNSIPEAVSFGAVIWFLGPIFVWMLVGTGQAIVAMVANIPVFLYLQASHRPVVLFGIDMAMPNSLPYVHSLMFLLLNICLPLALFRISYALRCSNRDHAYTTTLLQRSVTLYRDIFEHAGGATLICDQAGNVIDTNSRARSLFELSQTPNTRPSLPALFGHSPSSERAQAIIELARSVGVGEGELEFVRRDGSHRNMFARASRLTSGYGLMISMRDVTPLRSTQRELEQTRLRQSHLEHHDALTDLPNRQRVLEFLDELLQRKDRDSSDAMVAMVSIRLNTVRQVNEIFDTATGDHLIRDFGEALVALTASGRYLGRSHGVVFSLILTHCHTSSQLIDSIEGLKNALPDKLTIDGKALPIATSIGIAVHRDEPLSAEELMRRSKNALELARKNPDRPYVLFDEFIAREARRILDIEVALASAIEHNELFLQYQPKVEANGRIVCLEALLRWQSASLGRVPPTEFIPVAEQTGQIRAITLFVIESVFRQQRCWIDEFGQAWPVAINLSGIDLLHEDISALITMAGYRHDIPPALIQIEITETGIVKNANRALAQLNELAQRGYAIAIDDFGTGYSSLEKLSEFPISTIKIDRSFVSGIGVHQRREQIVRVTLSLAKILKCNVVAEGVETDAQLGFLVNHGCDLFQGYLFYQPLDVGAVSALLEEHIQRTPSPE